MTQKYKIRNSENFIVLGDKFDEGGFNDIFNCTIVDSTGNTVQGNLALKMIKEGINPQHIWRAEREMKYLERMSNEKILNPIYCDYDEYFIVMKKYPLSLAKFITENNYEKEDAYSIFADILEGVNYYTKQDILHRDLKPQNVLMTIENKIVITDFGASGNVDRSRTKSLTKTGQILYTDFYTAPEQIEDMKKSDVRSEIYSLGKILYSIEVKSLNNHSVQTDLISSLKLKHIINKCIKYNPDDRYQNIEELIKDFSTVYIKSDDWKRNLLGQKDVKSIVITLNEDILSKKIELENVISILDEIQQIDLEEVVDFFVYLEIESHIYMLDNLDQIYLEFLALASESIRKRRFPFDFIDTIMASYLLVLSNLDHKLELEVQANIIDSLVYLSTDHNRFDAMKEIGRHISKINEQILLNSLPIYCNEYDYEKLKHYYPSENLNSIIKRVKVSK